MKKISNQKMFYIKGGNCYLIGLTTPMILLYAANFNVLGVLGHVSMVRRCWNDV